MATPVNLTMPRFRGFTAAGTPLAGGTVEVYEAGTSTQLTTYTTFDQTTANTWPVTLDANGEADIWFDKRAKIILKDSAGVQQWSFDDVPSNPAPVLGGPDTANKVLNGGFESATAGAPEFWTLSPYASGTIAIDTGDQGEGKQSLLFTSTGSGGGTATSSKFEVTGGAIELVGFSLKSSVVNVRNLVEINWYTDADVYISKTVLYDDQTANPTTWTRKYISATAPSTARRADITITGAHSSNTNAGTTRFDLIVSMSMPTEFDLGKLANVSTYFETLFPAVDSTAAQATLDLTDTFNVANQFSVAPVSGALQVTVDKGYYRTKTYPLGVAVSAKTVATTAPVSAGNSKIDFVVLDVSSPQVPNIKIVAGTEGTSPTAPSLQPYEIPLATVKTSYGDTEISASNITDVRSILEPRGFSGALLYLTADVDVTSPGVTLSWGAEEYDINRFNPLQNNFHSTSVNTSRITIPEGVDYVRFKGQVAMGVSPAAGNVTVSLVKNGVYSVRGTIDTWKAIGSNESYYVDVSSAVLKVVPGDYFELYVLSTATGVHNMLASKSWFSVEVVD